MWTPLLQIRALKWIKRFGTDNQGWEVLVGDTGWINLPIVSKLGGSYLKVRRVNNTVMYQFGGLSWAGSGLSDVAVKGIVFKILIGKEIALSSTERVYLSDLEPHHR